jgi:hypothetical protein
MSSLDGKDVIKPVATKQTAQTTSPVSGATIIIYGGKKK